MSNLVRLDQGEELPHLVHGSKAAGEDDQGLGGLRKPEFTHEEVAKNHAQLRGDVWVGRLLHRQHDIESDGFAARLARPAIRSFHNAGSPARTNHEKPRAVVECPSPLSGQSRELAGVFVVARHVNVHAGALDLSQRRRVGTFLPAQFQFSQFLDRHIARLNAR